MKLLNWRREGTKPPSRLRQLIIHYLWSVKWGLALALISVLGETLTDILNPWPLKIIIDNVLLGHPLPSGLSWLSDLMAQRTDLVLLVLASSMALIALVQSVFSYWQTYLTSRIGFQLVTTLRSELFTHLQRLPLSFHQQMRRGELLTKVSSDTQALKDAFTDSGLALITNGLTLIGMFVVMFAINWQLSLVPLITVPLILWVFIHIQSKLKVSVRKQRKKEGEIAAHLSENLAVLPVVQAFGQESQEAQRFDLANQQNLEEGVQTSRLSAALTRSISTISAAGVAAVVFFGAKLALEGQLTPGDLLLFVTYVRGMYKPLRDMVKLSAKITKAFISAQRIGEILDIEPEIQDKPDAIVVSHLRGDIVFDHVSFDYAGSDDATSEDKDAPVTLSDLSFDIRAGERVALVGASGAGKSTVTNLILRLYEPDQGYILIDGIDVQEYQRQSLRQQIGLVLQDSLLFGASVRENISYGKPDATLGEIMAAARQAHIHDFILSLPNQYETVIGEMGSTLSGGQRQRIAIARALVKQPSILILDEPTSALDAESKTLVTETIHHIHEGRTILVITHQLSTVQDFDQILVLDKGRIVEQGTHQELLRRMGVYAQLYRLQEGPAMSMAPGAPVNGSYQSERVKD